MCKVFTHRNAKTKNRKTAISRQPENRHTGRMAQMKATDIKNKTSSHSSQNLRGRTLSFLVIYVLVTCGPVAPHCARMTNFMKHQIFISSQCTIGRPKFLQICLPHFFVNNFIIESQRWLIWAVWKSFSVTVELPTPNHHRLP